MQAAAPGGHTEANHRLFWEAAPHCGRWLRRYRNRVAMYEPDEDDVVEQGGAPLRLPGWARRPGWVPAFGWRPPRRAAVLVIAGLIVGLAAGYALGYRHP